MDDAATSRWKGGSAMKYAALTLFVLLAVVLLLFRDSDALCVEARRLSTAPGAENARRFSEYEQKVSADPEFRRCFFAPWSPLIFRFGI